MISCNRNINNHDAVIEKVIAIKQYHEGIGFSIRGDKKYIHISNDTLFYNLEIVYDKKSNIYRIIEKISSDKIPLLRNILLDANVDSSNSTVRLENRINYLLKNCDSLGIISSHCVYKTKCVDCKFLFKNEDILILLKDTSCIKLYDNCKIIAIEGNWMLFKDCK